MSIDRREINALCEEHDRLMREMEASGHWVPPPKRPPPVTREKAAPVVLEYRDNSAPATDPALVEAIGRVIGGERVRARKERAEEVAALQTEIAELRGQVTALLTLLGSKDGEGKIVDLPKLAWRRGA